MVGNDIELIIKNNVLAVISSNKLTVMSSAIYNGGCRNTKVIINTQVFDDYGDKKLHENPVNYIIECSKKISNIDDFVGMVTYASINDFSLVKKKEGALGVSVVATAGCTHAESSGEEIEVEEISGTINIIVLIDGNPTASCLASSIITATEAKTAALRDLDLRSRYSGLEATGTVTDALVVAKTGQGENIVYGGPATKLGKLIASCTRSAVKEAIIKAKIGGYHPRRSIIKRLAERKLSVQKLATEISKIDNLTLESHKLEKILLSEPTFASILLAATKLDEDIKKELIPKELENLPLLSRQFGKMLLDSKNTSINKKFDNYSNVKLPLFTKHVLIAFLINNNSKEKNENLK